MLPRLVSNSSLVPGLGFKIYLNSQSSRKTNVQPSQTTADISLRPAHIVSRRPLSPLGKQGLCCRSKPDSKVKSDRNQSVLHASTSTKHKNTRWVCQAPKVPWVNGKHPPSDIRATTSLGKMENRQGRQQRRAPPKTLRDPTGQTTGGLPPH